MTEIEKLQLTSLDIKEEQISKLKSLFPEVFTEGNKIDFTKLKLTLGENVDTGKERFGMNWPGKSECFKTIQQPSIATLIPAKEESVNFDTTENLFIEGDNLEVLKLLQKSYLGKIKMIYIDPPYNTGKEFIYPDNYTESLDTYLEYSGQIDGEGRKFSTNTDTEGRFHSKWMNMMYPRLFLARNLLRDDGVIFISIDDNEVDNLKKICNEIFGEENFVANIIWQRKRGRDNSAKWFSKSHEYLMVYAKNCLHLKTNNLELDSTTIEAYKNPDNDHRGIYRMLAVWARGTQGGVNYEYISNSGQRFAKRDWLFSENNLKKLENEGKLIFKGDNIYRKLFLTENKGKIPETIWNHTSNAANAADEIKRLFKQIIFDTPKPVPYLIEILKIATSNNDLVLDFFSGSNTMAHAVLELNKEDGGNRKFICVQLPEPTDKESEAFKAGYKTIADIGKERIRKVIKKIEEEKAEEEKKKSAGLFDEETTGIKTDIDLGFKVFKLQKSNFNIWNGEVEKKDDTIEQQLFNHIDHIDENADEYAILYELLLKAGFTLTTKIEELQIEGKKVYSIEAGELLICLEKELTAGLLTKIAEKNPTRVICLDEGFKNNDQLKANTVLTMKKNNVTKFQTV